MHLRYDAILITDMFTDRSLVFTMLEKIHMIKKCLIYFTIYFTSASAMVIYVGKLPLGACSIRACSFSDSPSTKLLAKFNHCFF